MKLYHYPLSGHAHRVALFLSVVGIDHELVNVDMAAGAHRQPGFLALNAFGEIPVLDDNGIIIADSLAILVYTARKVGPSHWLPTDPVAEARVQRWLSVAAGKIAYGASAARLITVFGKSFNAEEVIGRAHATLAVMEQALQDQRWIAETEAPTIADIALYSYVERAPEGNVDLSGYPAVRAWLRRVETLPGFVPFQRTPAGLEA
ncbi:glutathione S-transferase family protein [Pusillimonas noertemannii]|uniref:Glutathione S-transferase n=1 Tax=Pusillimonas noertemannii TaxID=305977 RepID=A0A2U1CMP2_9BURK|nr:glutathione S-transferase [Pusillimonas noertemannii]NYT68711.1 glutathione S-transferase family protein [Pusillimonas noertemannii]PVY62270.1 glutathione S-transferase [Pusillimonas noertemannii]TFL10753.1 glutathione S-transferase family protein [Pusillimonas noertemannii]